MLQTIYFVNVSAQNTIVLVYRKMLESYHVYNIGIPKQEGVDSSEYYLIKSEALKKIAKDVKKVLYNTKITIFNRFT